MKAHLMSNKMENEHVPSKFTVDQYMAAYWCIVSKACESQRRFFLEVSKPLGGVPKLDSSHWQEVQALENYLLLLQGPL